MGIDNRTLVLVLGLTNLIQLAVFAHQYLVNKTFRGINWWLLWGAAEPLRRTMLFLMDRLTG